MLKSGQGQFIDPDFIDTKNFLWSMSLKYHGLKRAYDWKISSIFDMTLWVIVCKEISKSEFLLSVTQQF